MDNTFNNLSNSWKIPQITWATVAGLFQTDGSFGFLIQPDGTFKPYASISQSPKRREWILSIISFLENEGLKVQEDISSKKAPNRGTNIKMDRINNCKLLIKKLDSLTENGRPILMDAKLRDYLLWKEAFLANDQRTNNKSDLKTQTLGRQKLFDLKYAFELFRPTTSENLKPEIMKQRLKLNSSANNTRINYADQILAEIDSKIDQIESKTFNEMLQNQFQITENIGKFIGGVFDGDGSFQVNTLTHLDDPTRVPFEFLPMITLTNKLCTRKNTIYDLLNYAFLGEKAKVALVSSKINADRYTCKSQEQLKNGVVPFFDKWPLTIKRNYLRFEALKKALTLIPQQHKDINKAIELLNLIYDNPEIFDLTL